MVDMVPEARRWHKACMDAGYPAGVIDGKETETMKMVRLMADDIEGWERVFEAWINANLRLCEMWRADHPDKETPKPADMIVWACDELDKIRVR